MTLVNKVGKINKKWCENFSATNGKYASNSNMNISKYGSYIIEDIFTSNSKPIKKYR